MNGYPPLLTVGRSFVTGLHPLLKALMGAGLLMAFLIIPDYPRPVIAAKVAILILLWLGTGGTARWKSLFRVFIGLAGFLGILLVCTVLGQIFSDQGSFAIFRDMVLKSFWTVTITFLIAGTIHYRECVYLSRILKIPQAISSQVLLIILIWGKFFNEFSRVPLAWKARGITPQYLRRHPGMIAGLLKVVLFRVTCQATRLELSLVSRGFNGRLYTCSTAIWSSLDSMILMGFMIMICGLLLISLC